ncbi:MAG: zinc-binding dehydrogenase [Tabrizicola sp.]|nr:zinc-binding dehydrogenase [Tabrizicola sp.]
MILSERGASAPLASLSVDGILDTVGAPVFAAGLAALRPNGVYSLVGAVAGSAVDFDLWSLLRPLTLTGYSSEDLDGPTLRAAVAELADWVLTGRMAAPDHITVPLAEAARAHAMLERRGHKGRILLVP